MLSAFVTLSSVQEAHACSWFGETIAVYGGARAGDDARVCRSCRGAWDVSSTELSAPLLPSCVQDILPSPLELQIPRVPETSFAGPCAATSQVSGQAGYSATRRCQDSWQGTGPYVLKLMWLRFRLYESIMPLKFFVLMERAEHWQTSLQCCAPDTQRCFCMRKPSCWLQVLSMGTSVKR